MVLLIDEANSALDEALAQAVNAKRPRLAPFASFWSIGETIARGVRDQSASWPRGASRGGS
jgi:ABC-type iron transport system FetAB ATPase subunit